MATPATSLLEPDRSKQPVSPANYRKKSPRLPMLDGWRAFSILAVVAGHWFPLGPSYLQLNVGFAAAGMATFFCLSGFLITQFLLFDNDIKKFFVRRLLRIVPVAWLAITILVIVHNPSPASIVRNYLFVANLKEPTLLAGGEHLWSLCLEVQFYLGIGLLCLILGRRAFVLIPILCIFITTLRFVNGEVMSIFSQFRVDEILSGSCLALLHNRGFFQKSFKWAPLISISLCVILILASTTTTEVYGYARPYLAASMVGISLCIGSGAFKRLMESRQMAYIASISYAFYVYHGMLGATWLGGNDLSKIMKYALRVPLFLVTWICSHFSTFYYEKHFIELAHNYHKTSQKKK